MFEQTIEKAYKYPKIGLTMEVTVTQSEKGKLVLEATKDQGFLNVVKAAVWEQSGVEQAGLRIKHPEDKTAEFVLKTKSKEPKKVWNEALDTVKGWLSSLDGELKKFK